MRSISQDYLVASPSQIAETLWTDRELLADNAWVTLKEVLLGLGFALLAGLAFAVVLHLSRTLRNAVYPLLIASQTIPVIVIAPILIVWFDFGLTAKVVIIALVCFFPITVNALDGLRSVDGAAVKMMRTLGRLALADLPPCRGARRAARHVHRGEDRRRGRRDRRRVRRVGGHRGGFIGEAGGLGHLMLQDNAQLQTPRLFAAVVVLSAIAVGLFALISAAERRVVHWR